ncbi:hypothetical protein [Cellulosimicrobium sp. NPDC057127]|uniref:hypothetical protein n=1 Tax=Cellulosimicrobium sp. NPDC057127 TaxID=3346026 RepID=UPI00362BDA0B
MNARPPLLRVLLGFSLLGAGIVNLGLVRGTFPAPAGVLALMLGAAETAAALPTLAGTAPRRASPTALGRLAVGSLVLASVAQAAFAVAPGATLGPAVTATAALQLAAAGAVGILTRSAPPGAATTTAQSVDVAPHPGRHSTASLGALFLGAVLISTVATFGLSGTEAAEHAVPHGQHHLPDIPGLHQHHP